MNDANLDTQKRNFFKASVAAASGVAVGGTGLLGHANAQTQARTGQLTSRRKLGQLEVSSIGLGELLKAGHEQDTSNIFG